MAGRRARSARPPGRPRSQHFLRSQTLAAELVREASVRGDELVLEIGAGGGRLTTGLAGSARRVVAVELDPAWAARLRGRWPNVEIVCADALALPLPAEPFRVVANLPFHRTTDVLRLLLDDPCAPLTRADLIVEWGVAVKRAVVWPSTLLGVAWGAWWTFALERRLAAACFDPRPAVDAAVLRIERRRPELVPASDWREYRRFVRAAFERGVRAAVPPRRLRALADTIGFDPEAAPRELDAHQWASLYRALREERARRGSGVAGARA